MLCIENKEENDYIAKILSVGFEDMEVWLGISNIKDKNKLEWLSICQSTYFNFAGGGPDFTPKVNEITGAAMEIPNGKFRAARGTLAKFCVCQDSFGNGIRCIFHTATAAPLLCWPFAFLIILLPFFPTRSLAVDTLIAISLLS